MKKVTASQSLQKSQISASPDNIDQKLPLLLRTVIYSFIFLIRCYLNFVIENNQNNQCARCARFMHNFFQNDFQPIKVYIFGKLSSWAFQKYILLWVYDYSEKSYRGNNFQKGRHFWSFFGTNPVPTT